MAKNKNLLEEALKEANAFNAMMAENSSSLIIKEGLENAIDDAAEDDETEGYDESDVDAELDVEDENLDDELDMEGDDLDVADDADLDVEDDIDFDVEGEDEELEIEDDVEGDDLDVADEEEDVVVDMTDASDDEVIRVFKKMSDNDEIEIADDSVKITDPESGNEYKVEMGADEIVTEDFDFGFDIDELEDEFGVGEDDFESDPENNPYTRGKSVARDAALRDIGREKKDARFDDEFTDSPTVNRELGYKSELDLDPVGAGAEDPRFDNADMVDDEEPLFEIEIEDEDEDALLEVFGREEDEESEGQEEENEEALEEQIPVGSAQAKRVPASNALGAKLGGAGAYAELKEAYNKLKAKNAQLLATSKELVKENASQRKALEVIKERIEETKVYTQNTNAVSRLFIEHSTTKAEKQNIVNRFKTVKTIQESVALENTIKGELTSRNSLTESVKNKINMNVNSGVSKSVMTESIDPQIARARRLM